MKPLAGALTLFFFAVSGAGSPAFAARPYRASAAQSYQRAKPVQRTLSEAQADKNNLIGEIRLLIDSFRETPEYGYKALLDLRESISGAKKTERINEQKAAASAVVDEVKGLIEDLKEGINNTPGVTTVQRNRANNLIRGLEKKVEANAVASLLMDVGVKAGDFYSKEVTKLNNKMKNPYETALIGLITQLTNAHTQSQIDAQIAAVRKKLKTDRVLQTIPTLPPYTIPPFTHRGVDALKTGARDLRTEIDNLMGPLTTFLTDQLALAQEELGRRQTDSDTAHRQFSAFKRQFEADLRAAHAELEILTDALVPYSDENSLNFERAAKNFTDDRELYMNLINDAAAKFVSAREYNALTLADAYLAQVRGKVNVYQDALALLRDGGRLTGPVPPAFAVETIAFTPRSVPDNPLQGLIPDRLARGREILDDVRNAIRITNVQAEQMPSSMTVMFKAIIRNLAMGGSANVKIQTPDGWRTIRLDRVGNTNDFQGSGIFSSGEYRFHVEAGNPLSTESYSSSVQTFRVENAGPPLARGASAASDNPSDKPEPAPMQALDISQRPQEASRRTALAQLLPVSMDRYYANGKTQVNLTGSITSAYLNTIDVKIDVYGRDPQTGNWVKLGPAVISNNRNFRFLTQPLPSEKGITDFRVKLSGKYGQEDYEPWDEAQLLHIGIESPDPLWAVFDRILGKSPEKSVNVNIRQPWDLGYKMMKTPEDMTVRRFSYTVGRVPNSSQITVQFNADLVNGLQRSLKVFRIDHNGNQTPLPLQASFPDLITVSRAGKEGRVRLNAVEFVRDRNKILIVPVFGEVMPGVGLLSGRASAPSSPAVSAQTAQPVLSTPPASSAPASADNTFSAVDSAQAAAALAAAAASPAITAPVISAPSADLSAAASGSTAGSNSMFVSTPVIAEMTEPVTFLEPPPTLPAVKAQAESVYNEVSALLAENHRLIQDISNRRRGVTAILNAVDPNDGRFMLVPTRADLSTMASESQVPFGDRNRWIDERAWPREALVRLDAFVSDRNASYNTQRNLLDSLLSPSALRYITDVSEIRRRIALVRNNNDRDFTKLEYQIGLQTTQYLTRFHTTVLSLVPSTDR